MQRCQHAVPDIAADVDSLPRACAKGARSAGCAPVVGGHDHQKRIERHRHEGLRAQGVAFDHRKRQGQNAGLGLKQADAGAAIDNVDPGLVMPAPAQTLVDDAIGGA